ncbi:hypothetical protein JHK82_055133 [Glycine max]|nr:hypothetical protein JHK86_054974 [Glycine max]KAG4917666.1 hypothetical protein JHK85_055947 [Glycine max]KAG5073764.1 hypothetical protein JHK84_054995 [Glycine max]KAG5076438.1 hypothetical protein JHK82_055133 [Glycine max]
MVVTALWVEHNDDIGMPIDVALGSLVKSQNPATFPDSVSQASNSSEVGSQATLKDLN